MIPRPPYERRILLKEQFCKEIGVNCCNKASANEWRNNGFWGGYTRLQTWPGSCGNKEWTSLANQHLPSACENPIEVAYWMLMIKRLHKKWKLGNLFFSYPTIAGKSFRPYEMIADATQVLKLKPITRSVNPNYGGQRWQEVYLLAGDLM